MFCPHCGNENKDIAKFCAVCGGKMESFTSIPDSSTPPTPKPVKATSPAIQKESMIRFALASSLVLLYSGIFIFFLLLLNNENAISVSTVFNSDVKGYMTLKELLDVLISGNKIFNPTVVSAAIGIGIYTFIYSIPFFAVVAIVSAILKKKSFTLYTVSTIITVLSAVAAVLITPLSVIIIPNFKQAIAASAGIIINDIDGISFIPIIIFAAIILVLTIVTGVVTKIFIKRRMKKDEK